MTTRGARNDSLQAPNYALRVSIKGKGYAKHPVDVNGVLWNLTVAELALFPASSQCDVGDDG